MRTRTSTLRAAVSTPRLLGATSAVVLLEGVLRLGIALALEPSFGSIWVLAATILWPPVVAVVGLGLAVPTVLGVLETVPESPAVGPRHRWVPWLLVFAFVGHAMALLGGVAVFLLVDTPIRYLLYGLGHGGLVTFEVVMYGPLAWIGVGTLLSWSVGGIAVVRIVTGQSAGRALLEAAGAALSRPRPIGVLVAGHLAFVGYATAVMVVLERTGRWLESTGGGSGELLGAVVLLAVGILLLVGGGAIWLTGVLTVTAARFGPGASDGGRRPGVDGNSRRADGSTRGVDERSRESNPPSRPVPLRTLALVFLVVTGLVVAASAVRVGEVRPVDTEPDPLPADADDLFATALANTDRTNHEFRALDLSDGSAEPVTRTRVDRETRELVVVIDDLSQYYSNGIMHHGGPTGTHVPGYAMVTQSGEEEIPKIGEPDSTIHNWTVVDSGDELVLENTDEASLFRALAGSELEAFADEPAVHEARAEVRIDPDRKTVSEAEYRIDVTDRADPEREYAVHARHEYEYDVTVERPEELGPPSTAEWIWRVIAY